MRINYSKEVDALYIELNDKPYHHSKRLDSYRCIDYSDDGDMIGVEILRVSKHFSLDDIPNRGGIIRQVRGSYPNLVSV